MGGPLYHPVSSDLVSNASNLTPWGDYSAGKNSRVLKYGIGPYDPFGTAWGVSSYDFISREKFNESYDAWVAAGLYFNNQTDSGTHSYDHIYSALYISSTKISWLILLCSLCGSKKETSRGLLTSTDMTSPDIFQPSRQDLEAPALQHQNSLLTAAVSDAATLTGTLLFQSPAFRLEYSSHVGSSRLFLPSLDPS